MKEFEPGARVRIVKIEVENYKGFRDLYLGKTGTIRYKDRYGWAVNTDEGFQNNFTEDQLELID